MLLSIVLVVTNQMTKILQFDSSDGVNLIESITTCSVIFHCSTRQLGVIVICLTTNKSADLCGRAMEQTGGRRDRTAFHHHKTNIVRATAVAGRRMSIHLCQ